MVKTAYFPYKTGNKARISSSFLLNIRLKGAQIWKKKRSTAFEDDVICVKNYKGIYKID
jgi:hypothetical protein